MGLNMNNKDYPCHEQTQAILNCAFDVINGLRHGLNEKIYEHALVVEFNLRSIRCTQQARYPVLYKGHQVGEFIPDLIAADAVVVDVKCIERITDHERGKMINYLRITGLTVGLILNFKRARLEYERVVLTADKTSRV
jgi:GxxExxY protein